MTLHKDMVSKPSLLLNKLIMFKKVLIAEDQHTIHKGLEATLNELFVAEVHNVAYCDDALLKINSALLANAPYDLLTRD